MKALILFFLLIGITFSSLAQIYLPQITGTDFHEDIYNFKKDEVRMLEDCGNNWTIEQVSKAPILKQFHENRTTKEGFNYECSVYWIYYRLQNKTDADVQLVASTIAEKSEFFIQDSLNKWKILKTGYLVPADERDGFKLYTAVVFTIKANTTTNIFIKRSDNYIFGKSYGVNPSVRKLHTVEQSFINEFDVVKGTSKNYFFGGFMFGVLFLLTVFNISFFLVSKEKIYLYYVLFLICLVVGRYFIVIYQVFLSDFPKLYYYGTGIIFIGHFIGLVQFIRHLLPIKSYYPKLDSFLLPYTVFAVLLANTIFFLKGTSSYANDAKLTYISETLIISVYSLIPLVLILLSRKRDKNVTKIFIFTSPVLLSWIAGTFILSTLTLITKLEYVHADSAKYGATYSALQVINSYKNLNVLIEAIALLWLVSFFAWELIKRYNLLRQEIARQETEKERLAKEKEIERNQLIESQKVELEHQVEERTAELKHSLETLKATQTQLIQKEKMASLGELTAGIAHEIQNPLNFVNNFSEVSTELIEELKEEAQAGNTPDVLAIADDLTQNLQKISHHGGRASAIVRGMLEHSRTSTGEREPTDLNALTDEYLRLAYQGMRAKDKEFTCELVTDFAPDLGLVKVVSQDIGRVLLNLYNNAFYAVQQKQKTAQTDYQPTIGVSTHRLVDAVEIRVSDNGVGIPDPVKAKIFQPFFTTKPTGEGTGLGLSLAYDIITKGHSGTLEVQTTPGQFTEFIITLPTL